MKKTVILIVIGIISIASINAVMSPPGWGEPDDGDQYEHELEDSAYGFLKNPWLGSRVDVPQVENETYRSECGACHFAYQPGLLPQYAWEQVMDSLEDHYGDDASLGEVQAAEIRTYLLTNAADRTSHQRSRVFAARANTSDTLPRITDTSYFRREHYEIPTRFVQENKDVGSFSNCQACHRNADAGSYDEHQVMIPNVGRWDD